MKKALLAVALGAIGMVASAQSEQVVEEVRISAGLARIEVPSELHNVWQTEFDQIAGTYRLSNGKTMQLSMWGNRMYAKVDGMPRHQLAAVTPYVFVARDLQMKIRVSNIESSGPIKAELMLAEPAIAGSPAGLTYTSLIATR